jgi:hypothetical protein
VCIDSALGSPRKASLRIPRVGSDLRDNHRQGDEVHAHRISNRVIQDINILAEAIRNSAKRRRVEERHGRAKNAGNRSVQHRLSGFGAKDGDRPGEKKHE